MKKLMLLATLAVSINTAYSAETAVLKLQGTLTNSACVPEMSNGGVVDYGMIHLGELSATETNQLGKKDFTLTINCVTPSKMAFSVNDDRAGTLADIKVKNGTNDSRDVIDTDKLFGINKTAGGVNIGNYSMNVRESSMTIDGAAGRIIYSADQGTTWEDLGVGEVMYNRTRIVSVAAKGQTTPLAFTTAVLPMSTVMAIQDTTTLAITDDTQIDGQATFTLIYL
ncbi:MULTISPECIES: DUF1120 domain-containing protein [Enterobacter]|uniref:DUF1120 domain-containing protein n=1 Tax=Enterobacter TaxID=547 RepID=UPI0028EA0282|nr:DUF1120 domain-containing protein [Enterobacter cloacae]HDR2753592.1 DUF1120 domain-containing protein [Enterobacter asburiae]WNT36053.1 DUF1120 domain-containing protein [Enterobacter cloacae]HDR2787423.1 DUF1120 domain-containing protein [Enterobacter asburiae]HDR2794057.1 DUF1120 domain-containing protein [Enterobacter asburiae]HDR2799298.1 DUF1120 domain-containing protein [Enterobacter asburiae]